MRLAMMALFLIGFVLSTRGDQNINIAASASPAKVTIGDQIQLQIRLTHPTAYKLNPLTMSTLGDFVMTGMENSNARPKDKDTMEEKLQIVLTTFSTGTVTIPQIPLILARSQGEPLMVKTAEIPIEVASVLDKHKDRGDIQEIKGQIGFFNLMPWILGALCLAALGLVAWVLSKKRKSQSSPSRHISPPRPPEVIAREALAKLQGSRLIEEGRVKEFYIEFSDILRRYVEGRFGIACLDRTTTEIVSALKSLQLSSTDFRHTKELLEDCDLVKFAKFMPAPEEPARHIAIALELIENTTPQLTLAR